MSTGIFLVTAGLLIVLVAAFEIRAWVIDPNHLITTLSKKYAPLRWLIESVFVLGAWWWLWHSS